MNPFSQLVCGASMLSGIAFEKILRFFAILSCAFPSIRTIYYGEQYVVRPMIQEFYETQQRNLINNLLQAGNGLHLCLDG